MPKALVLDANILLRAVLGRRARQILETYEDRAEFCAPESSFDEAREHLADVCRRRGLDQASAVVVLDRLSRLVAPVSHALYSVHERIARERIARRDPDDWPLIAVALLIDAPIWTEDRDLFGTGIAVWTTDRVELYLRE